MPKPIHAGEQLRKEVCGGCDRITDRQYQAMGPAAAGAPESESRAGDHQDRYATLATGISFTSQLANTAETGGTDVWPAR